MQLQLLKEDRCKDCNAEAVSESCLSRHTNGQGFEERTFACGRTIRWSPNFNRQETVKVCPKSHEAIVKQEKIEKARQQLLGQLHWLDVDAEWKEKLARDILHA